MAKNTMCKMQEEFHATSGVSRVEGLSEQDGGTGADGSRSGERADLPQDEQAS